MSGHHSGEKRPNRLIHESSPYLRQHAHNPVDWHPWGEDAFRKAKELDRPIFLSIGYSSCHWCHVMERESFEDERIARLLNGNFVSIKVDREERPDVDSVYMTAVQLMSRHGGWPLSVFLDPQLRPFWGGTYFPPRSRRGLLGFEDVLLSISSAYRDRRSDIEETAGALIGYLETEVAFREEDLPSREDFDGFVDHLSRGFDKENGGFGPPPKFPRSFELSLLLRLHARTGDPPLREMCDKTLGAMARGGIYDHLGGGFHRYSTDERWLVPHFEKMLYDNALLAKTYTDAWSVTGEERYRQVVFETLDYLLDEMRGADGGFYSATDADSPEGEGAYFVWTPQEIEEAVGPETARLVCAYYGVTDEGNFEHHKSVLHVTRGIEEVAADLGLEKDAAARTLEEARRTLEAARRARVPPSRDEKVLVAWNALATSALARAAQVFDEARFKDAAVRAAELILTEMMPHGRLLRVRKDGESKVLAFLDDHAYFAGALLDLYETTFDVRYLHEARGLADFIIHEFSDPHSGGFYYTADDHEELIVRRKETFDSATPAGGAVAALALLRLERLTGVSRYREEAEEFFRSVKGALRQAPSALASTLIAADFWLHDPVEVVIVGAMDDPATEQLLRAVHETFLPASVLVAADPRDAADLAPVVPLLAGKGDAGAARAYVCHNFTCRAAVQDPDDLRAELRFAHPATG